MQRAFCGVKLVTTVNPNCILLAPRQYVALEEAGNHSDFRQAYWLLVANKLRKVVGCTYDDSQSELLDEVAKARDRDQVQFRDVECSWMPGPLYWRRVVEAHNGSAELDANWNRGA